MSDNSIIRSDGCLAAIGRLFLLIFIAASPWIIVYYICKLLKVRCPMLVVLCGILAVTGVLLYTDPVNTYDSIIVKNEYGISHICKATAFNMLSATLCVPLIVHMYNNMSDGADTIETILRGKNVYKEAKDRRIQLLNDARK